MFIILTKHNQIIIRININQTNLPIIQITIILPTTLISIIPIPPEIANIHHQTPNQINDNQVYLYRFINQKFNRNKLLYKNHIILTPFFIFKGLVLIYFSYLFSMYISYPLKPTLCLLRTKSSSFYIDKFLKHFQSLKDMLQLRKKLMP